MCVCVRATLRTIFHISGGGPFPVGFVIVDNHGGGGSSIIAAVCIVSSRYGLRNFFLVETVCSVHMDFNDASDYHKSPRDARASGRDHHVIMFCVSFDFIIHVWYKYIRFVVSTSMHVFSSTGGFSRVF